MVWFIIALILIVVSLIEFIVGFRAKLIGSLIAGVVTALIAVVLLFMTTFWQNGEGEAKVLINSVDRTVVGTIENPGSGFKPAWVDTIDFDLFSQELVYAGGQDSPSYSGGTVNGREITVSVGGTSGGSTKANIDATFVYSIDADKIDSIYREFKSQERFTQMVVEKTVLSVARQVPSNYSAIEFRGAKRGEAETAIMTSLNEKLAKYGVEFAQVTIQDVRYPESVENALNAIEEANQKAQEAEANQRTKQVQADTKVIEAQGEAEANRILNESLTPSVLESRRIDALLEAAKNNNLIITDGTNADVLVQQR